MGMLPLAIGMPVVLTEHIDRAEDKLLLRGKPGVVHSWLWPDGQTRPSIVYVKFEGAEWQLEGLEQPGVYPVVPKTRPWYRPFCTYLVLFSMRGGPKQAGAAVPSQPSQPAEEVEGIVVEVEEAELGKARQRRERQRANRAAAAQRQDLQREKIAKEQFLCETALGFTERGMLLVGTNGAKVQGPKEQTDTSERLC